MRRRRGRMSPDAADQTGGDEDDDMDIIIASCGRRWKQGWVLGGSAGVCHSIKRCIHCCRGVSIIINHARRGGNGNFARNRGVGPPEG